MTQNNTRTHTKKYIWLMVTAFILCAVLATGAILRLQDRLDTRNAISTYPERMKGVCDALDSKNAAVQSVLDSSFRQIATQLEQLAAYFDGDTLKHLREGGIWLSLIDQRFAQIPLFTTEIYLSDDEGNLLFFKANPDNIPLKLNSGLMKELAGMADRLAGGVTPDMQNVLACTPDENGDWKTAGNANTMEPGEDLANTSYLICMRADAWTEADPVYVIIREPAYLFYISIEGVGDVSSVLVDTDTIQSFAVGADDGNLYCYGQQTLQDSGIDSCERIGLKLEELHDGYSGPLMIEGVRRQAYVRKYPQNLVCPDLYLILAENGVISGNRLVVIFAVILLVAALLLVLLYALWLKRDRIFDGREEEDLRPVGKRMCYSRYDARRLIAFVTASVFAVTGIIFGLQTVTGLTDSIRRDARRTEIIRATISYFDLFSNFSDTISNDTMGNDTAMMALLVEHNLDRVMSLSRDDMQQADSRLYRTYYRTDTDGQRVPMKDSLNHDRTARLCIPLPPFDTKAQWSMPAVRIYDLSGYQIATTEENDWSGVLPTDPSDPLYPMTETLERKRPYVILTGADRPGEDNIKVAVPITLYMRDSENGTTEWLSDTKYVTAEQAGDPGIHTEPGLLVVDRKKNAIVGSAIRRFSYEGLFSTYGEDDDGMFALFDEKNMEKPQYMSGKLNDDSSLRELPEYCFRDGYCGFHTVAGIRCFVHTEQYQYGDSEEDYRGSGLVMSFQPVSGVYADRNLFTLFYALIAAGTMLLLSVGLLISNAHRDTAIMEWSERREVLFIRMDEHRTAGGVRTDKPWKQKDAAARISVVSGTLMFILLVVLWGMYIGSSADPERLSVSYFISEGRWAPGVTLFSCIAVACLFIEIGLLVVLLRKVTNKFIKRLSSRSETFGRLIVSIAKYVAVLAGVFISLGMFGLDTKSVLASVGAFSLLVGLGAKSMISDILAGIFIILEGEFGVGDIVTIGGFCGQVKEIGLRITKLEDMNGNVKILTNSSVSGVLNMSRNISRDVLELKTDASVQIAKMKEVMVRELPKLAEKYSNKIKRIEYKGVNSLSSSGNTYCIEAFCNEVDRVEVFRLLNTEIAAICEENGIVLK